MTYYITDNEYAELQKTIVNAIKEISELRLELSLAKSERDYLRIALSSALNSTPDQTQTPPKYGIGDVWSKPNGDVWTKPNPYISCAGSAEPFRM